MIKIQHIKRDINQWLLYLVAIVFFISIPLVSVVWNVFGGVGEMWEHILKYFLPDYIKNSFLLLFGTGVLTFLLGVSSAWIVANYEFRFRKLVQWLLFLPLAIPSYIMAYTYVGAWGNGGTLIQLLNKIGVDIHKIEVMNIYGLIWVLSLSFYPYVYAGSRALFIGYPKVLRESTALLGASKYNYFFRVALPLASPAIIGGLFLVFMEVLNDYGAAKYYGINTFTTGIFRTWTALEDLQSAVYLSAILVVIVFLILSLVKWLRKNKSYSLKLDETNEDKKQRTVLIGKKKIMYLSVLFVPVLFGLFIPVGQLVYWAVFSFKEMVTIKLFTTCLQSFGVALVTAVFVVLFSILIIYFSRWNVLKRFNAFTKFATIGYVIPGAIIGIAIIKSSQTIINFFYDTFELKVGYLFYGSSFVLIYAYIFRFLAVAFNPIEANSLKYGENLVNASYLLGFNKFKTFLKVELPLLKNILISTFVLVFIDVLKELPLTLILKPYDLNTLAVVAYEYADDERLAEAAVPALFLIAIIALLMFFIDKRKK